MVSIVAIVTVTILSKCVLGTQPSIPQSQFAGLLTGPGFSQTYLLPLRIAHLVTP